MTVIEFPGASIDDAATFEAKVVAPCRPAVLRGLAADWPAVRAAAESAGAAARYVAARAGNRPMEGFYAAPQVGGRYFYAEGRFGEFNFERRSVTVVQALDDILAAADGDGSVYLGSVGTRQHLPGFAEANRTALPPQHADQRIWIGTRSHVAAHYDTFDNLACVVAGRRRFTLYAPELTKDMYAGPLDRTLAGQPISLAASASPDDTRYPRFAAIRDRALVVELEPGDALYLPKLWWHQVEALAPFNILVNYWWDAFAAGPDSPFVTMMLAMIAIADRPTAERAAWAAFFDHYVFRGERHPLDHLPVDEHGMLGALKDGNYARIRTQVMQALRRG